MVLMYFFNLVLPKLTISYGDFTSLYKSFVALLTAISVDWAERTTETKKVNEFGEFSSLFGFLYSFESIKKIEFILLFFKKFTNLEHVS